MSVAIDRRSGLSLADFRSQYVSLSKPVILTDAIDHWPARHKWNFDYFETRFADKAVRFDGKMWNVGEFISALRRSAGQRNAPYLKEVKLDEQFPELWADVGSVALAGNNRLASRLMPFSMRIDRGRVALFIGTKGSGFRKLHWDYSYLHVFISQVHGGKDAIVFKPSDTPYLYPDPGQDNVSLIPDPYDVDLQAFPKFSLADPTRLTINEGETLFLPAGWWHATNINEPSIAIAESTLDGFNWAQRKNWYLNQYAESHTSLLKRLALNAYMSLIDKFL